MISDVLFEAIAQIKTYQKDLPGAYPDADMGPMIGSTLEVMSALQEYFDTPPADSDEGEKAQQDRFWKRFADAARVDSACTEADEQRRFE